MLYQSIYIIIEKSKYFRNRIYLKTYVFNNKRRVKREQRFYYSMKKYKHKVSFDILIDISDHVTLL